MSFIYKKNKDNSLTVRDEIYGDINIPYPFSKIVLTKEMQRLANISQNGFSQLEFKGLEHNNRLNHSVGAFNVMSMFLRRLEKILKEYDIEISNDDKEIALCSLLLHDIGHGPFSHSLELVTKYSHEQRTIDILFGNTEINQVITEIFGPEKLEKIADFILSINDEKNTRKDSFYKLLKSLVSHQIDADRIDYLIRDAHYIGFSSAIDINRIKTSMNVIVNNNQEYELLIDKKGLSSIENVLLQRYQMYRDVYLSPISVLGDWIFEKIIDRYKNSDVLKNVEVDDSFKSLATNPNIENLDLFLKMKDSDFKKSFQVLSQNDVDLVMAYLCDFDNIKDYVLINNEVSINKIKNRLKEIFNGFDVENTLSIVEIETKVKLYKKEQRLNIKNGNRIMDLSECTNLIRPQDVLEDKYVFFNPELLRIELGLSLEQFKQYEKEVNKMIDDLNKKPEEFELKYIIMGNYNEKCLLDKIILLFEQNGFEVKNISKKQNVDEYYDTKKLKLYKNDGSLRIRKVWQDDKEKIKATLKLPLERGEIYSSRREIEEYMIDDNVTALKTTMGKITNGINLDQILNFPILKSCTERTDIILDKNGVQVCLSFDNSFYFNHILNDLSADDRMIEIEAIGELNNRIILNEIHDFITTNFDNLMVSKQSKYERGISKTICLYNDFIWKIENSENELYNKEKEDVSVMIKKLK